MKAAMAERPYTLVAETQLTVNAVAQVIAVPPVGFTYTFILINRSALGQIIRAGFAPGFAPNVGLSALVNEAIIFSNVGYAVSVIASAAGALVDVTVQSQQYL